MIRKLHIDNFRCLVNFDVEWTPFTVLCGDNGAGKTSIFQALRFIRALTTGNGILGSPYHEPNLNLKSLDFTRFGGKETGNTVQTFELDISENGYALGYHLQIEQVASHKVPRIISEYATCDGEDLFRRDLNGVRFPKRDNSTASFPLDWRQSAVGAIQTPQGSMTPLVMLREWFENLLVFAPSPLLMGGQSDDIRKSPGYYMSEIISWYRHLSQEQVWLDVLRNTLKCVWPDFVAFKLDDAGPDTKVLYLRFGDALQPYSFSSLSDGEKQLIALYMIHAGLTTGQIKTAFIDEPDNYIGLPELQPWVLSLREVLDESRQVSIISHNPEVLNSMGVGHGRCVWRESHASPTRIGPLSVPDGLSVSEAVTRGWNNA